MQRLRRKIDARLRAYEPPALADDVHRALHTRMATASAAAGLAHLPELAEAPRR